VPTSGLACSVFDFFISCSFSELSDVRCHLLGYEETKQTDDDLAKLSAKHWAYIGFDDSAVISVLLITVKFESVSPFNQFKHLAP
jgi:hypothetical protein